MVDRLLVVGKILVGSSRQSSPPPEASAHRGTIARSSRGTARVAVGATALAT